jgi:hypothetical protein
MRPSGIVLINNPGKLFAELMNGNNVDNNIPGKKGEVIGRVSSIKLD